MTVAAIAPSKPKSPAPAPTPPPLLPSLRLESLGLVDRRRLSEPDAMRVGSLPGALFFSIFAFTGDDADALAFDRAVQDLKDEVVKPLAQARERFLAESPTYAQLIAMRAKILETEQELQEALNTAESALQEATTAVQALQDPGPAEERADGALRRQIILKRRLDALRPEADLVREQAESELRRAVHAVRREMGEAAKADAARQRAALVAALQPLLAAAQLADRRAALTNPGRMDLDLVEQHGLNELPPAPTPKRRAVHQRILDHTPGELRVFRVRHPLLHHSGQPLVIGGERQYLEVLVHDDSGARHKRRHLDVLADCAATAAVAFRRYNGIVEGIGGTPDSEATEVPGARRHDLVAAEILAPSASTEPTPRLVRPAE